MVENKQHDEGHGHCALLENKQHDEEHRQRVLVENIKLYKS